MAGAVKRAGRSRLLVGYWGLVALLILALGWIYMTYSYRGDHLRAAEFFYPEDVLESCPGGRGAVADHVARDTDAGTHFRVITPANYRAEVAHPLLVVWAPAGLNEALSERFTGLTGPATARGFVVAYVRSVPLGYRALRALAQVPVDIVAEWCIDPGRIAYTGHSDGGTVSNALAVLPGLAVRPAAIAPSAMGMQAADMAEFSCPEPTAVMLMHNLDDDHFPDYGQGVARWWADCNRCSDNHQPSDHPGCEAFSDCAATTLLCRAPGNHAHWPAFDHDAMRFLERSLLRPAPE